MKIKNEVHCILFKKEEKFLETIVGWYRIDIYTAHI